ncbi:hypothetical protein QUF99_08420 [Bacillus sp. DX4.1]|uniref:hypothetical protein n=1 Tax=Bacillus sp. DX4.1 TaxID=3055867 RepID=UPI0025A0E805|nr:hypothetical protein [Bacillus sp. DX4.1]MDM5187343.1 hypothetical protein [Bacillus sp. DX4.1]
MNEYEEVYHIKQNIEKSISENKLFELSIDEATLVVLEKVGVFYALSHSVQYEKIQGYMKTLAKTNATEINEISFIQESLKWIFRWCTKYCRNKSIINKEDLVADDIYNLMGIAYSYERFFDMWEMHRQKKVKYNKKGNKVTFDYIHEEIYKIHLFYDTIFREIDNEKKMEELDTLDVSRVNLTQIMNDAHQMDFNCSFNIEFKEFNLEDYKIFSTALTQMFTQNMLDNYIGENYIIEPGLEGAICLKKETWIYQLSVETKLDCEKIERIIDFFTYDFSDSKGDISLSYFVPLSDNYLVVSEAIFNLSRPEANAMRLLAKKGSSNYDFAQNNFEGEERARVKKSIGKKYLTSYGVDKSKKNIPGIDLLVYDPEINHLQIIELKYKIPIESTRDINNLDKMLEKAYKQVEEARRYTNDNLALILKEYFGETYRQTVPSKIDYFVLTNYSIGTGINASVPTPILLLDHYVELMKNRNGMELVRTVLNSHDKKLPIEQKKRYSRFSLLGYKILIPEYSFRFRQEYHE